MNIPPTALYVLLAVVLYIGAVCTINWVDIRSGASRPSIAKTAMRAGLQVALLFVLWALVSVGMWLALSRYLSLLTVIPVIAVAAPSVASVSAIVLWRVVADRRKPTAASRRGAEVMLQLVVVVLLVLMGDYLNLLRTAPAAAAVPTTGGRNNDHAWVYFISSDRSNASRVSLATGDNEIVVLLSHEAARDTRLCVFANSNGTSMLELWTSASSRLGTRNAEVVAQWEGAHAAMWTQDEYYGVGTSIDGTVGAIGQVDGVDEDLREGTVGMYGWDGVALRLSSGASVVRAKLDLPILSAVLVDERATAIRCVSYYQGMVVFQLGRDNIIAMDVLTGRMRFLGRGQGPVVVAFEQ